MPSRRGYGGVLGAPIPKGLVTKPTIAEGDVGSERKWKFVGLVLEKSDALCRHYNCDPGSIKNRHLVIELGKRFVPGFQIDATRSRGGRPKRWDDIALAMLWLYYLEMRGTNVRLTERAALVNMGKRKFFGVKTSRLKDKLPKAKKSPLVQMLMSPNPEDQKFAWNFLGDHL